MRIRGIFLILVAPLAMGQSTVPRTTPTAAADRCSGAPQSAFDVATVKPSQIAADSSRNGGSADTVTASGTALHMIQSAYDLRDFQVAGGPGWLDSATWDIVAKVDQPVTGWRDLRSSERRAIQQQRMQAVLAQRFGLKCHFETKELPVYNLVLGKGGTKLKPASDPAKKGSLDWDGDRDNRMAGTSIDLTSVTHEFAQVLGRTVIDKTGLSGIYDFTLTWTSQNDAASPVANDASSGPTLFTALQEQLGLRLESAKGPVPVLVVDSIARPSEN